MKIIVTELIKTTNNLFPSRKEVRMISGVIGLAIFISISELLMAHFFSLLILPDKPRSSGSLIFLSCIFLLSFAGLRLANFAKEHYKLRVFEQSFNNQEKKGRASDSWRWATAMELTTLLSMCGRLIVLSAILFYFSPIFGICNLLIGVGVFQVLSYRLSQQFESQYNFRHKQLIKEPVTNAEKVRTRIIAGEIGSLASSAGLIFLFGILIFLYAKDYVDPAKAFVLFIAIRMVGQIYSGFSSGLMRFARARVYSE